MCSTQVAPKHLYRVAMLTVSDSRHKGIKADVSGDEMENLLRMGSIFPCHQVIVRSSVQDEQDAIEFFLLRWADSLKFDLVLTIGGTGFSPRDVTPEATKRVCGREAPALAQAVISSCFRKTPLALLSRATCGIRKRTVILNLPGSVKGSRECFLEVANILPHAIDQLREDVDAVEKCHMSITQLPTNVVPSKSKVSVTKVATRNRVSPYKMVSSGDALKIILEHCYLANAEVSSISGSVGFISASDVIAKLPSPPFRASIKDGYAVFAAEGKGPRKVLGVMTAGDDPSLYLLEPGCCVRVSTGSPVPMNADCVVQVEDTVVTKKIDEGDEEIEINILTVPTPGQDIREAGSDIGVGEVIISKGKEITPFDCGIMAAAGISCLPVYKTSQVVILSTGDELTKAGEDPKPGCIVDSNNSTLSAMMFKLKLKFVEAGIAKDNPDDLLEKLVLALQRGDVIVITGGMSMGEKDYVKDVLLEDLSAEMHFGRIHMKPGKPTGFFTLTYDGRKKLVFCLPGNPVSAAVTFHLFVVPCLRMMMGHKNIMQLTMRAKLADDILLDPRPEYHRVSVTWEQQGDKPVARSTGNQISSRLLSFSEANGLMLLPPRTEEIPVLKAGSDVLVMLFDYFAPHLNYFYM